MTPADQHALREALARDLAKQDGWLDPDAPWTDNVGALSRGQKGAPVWMEYVEQADALISAPAIVSLIAERDAANNVCDMAAMSGGFYARTAENMERRALAAEAENTRLKETVETVEAALKPFADEADWYDPSDDDGDHIYIAGNMRIGHLRAARSVLATIPPKENPDA